MAIPEDVIREVVAATDLVDLIGRIVPLRRSGQSFVGLCPFHKEKTGSFNVSPTKQVWKCFGCGKAGDAIAFLREHDRLTFMEALQALADRAGIHLPAAPHEPSGGPARRDVYAALAFAADWFRRGLASPLGAEALAYVTRRGIKDEAAETFRLGYAPADPDLLPRALRKAGIAADVAEAAGLIRRRDGGAAWGYFRDRLIFPIADTQDRIVGFGARLLRGDGGAAEGPKYLNSPDSAVFSKRRLLYGLPQARADRSGTPLYVMEGYTDVIIAWQCGFHGAVATLGTAMGAEHLQVLRRFDRPVVLVYDGDAPGQAAAERAAEIALVEDCDLAIATIAGDKDPADLLLHQGAEALQACLAARVEAADFRLGRLRAAHDLATHAGRRQAAEAVATLLGKVANPVSADLLARRAAQVLGVGEAELRLRATQRGRGGARPGPTPMTAVPESLAPEVVAELDCVAAILAEPALAAEAQGIAPAHLLRDTRCQALYARVLALVAEGRSPTVQDLAAAFPEDPYRLPLARLAGHPLTPAPRMVLMAAAHALERRLLRESLDAWQRHVAEAEQRGDTAARDTGLRELAAASNRLRALPRTIEVAG